MPAIPREAVYAFEAQVGSDHLAQRRATASRPAAQRFDSSLVSGTKLGASFWGTNDHADLFLVNHKIGRAHG